MNSPDLAAFTEHPNTGSDGGLDSSIVALACMALWLNTHGAR